MSKISTYKIRDKSILVTGGAGFIGSHLVDSIVKESPKNLIVVDNFFLGTELNLKEARNAFPELEVFRVSAEDYSAMSQIVKRFAVDTIFDLATVPLPTSLVFPNWSVETNVRLALTLCELARMGEIDSLVHLSTSETYGTALYAPMDEKHPFNPSTPYAASKSSADQIIQSYMKTYGIDATVIRPFNNFGPRQNPGSYAGVIPKVICNVLDEKPISIFGDGNQTRDFSYVTRTADQILRIFKEDKCHNDVWNIGSGNEISVINLIQMILFLMDRLDHKIIHLPDRPGDVRRHSSDIQKVNSVLGISPEVINADDLMATIDWYRSNRT